MKIEQLFYFQEAAKHQSLAKASKVLNISVSSIAHAIRCLEEDLGCKLFKKEGRHIYLTEKGRTLSDRSSEVFQCIDGIKADIQSDNTAWKGVYRVGASPGLDSVYFLPSWCNFQKKYPKLILHYSSHRSSTIVELVSKGELDFGICFDPQDNPFIKMKTIATMPHLISVRRRHPVLRSKKSIQLRDLLNYSCCTPKIYPGIETCKQHEILNKNRVKPNIDFAFDSYISAVHRVRNSDSWCFIPKVFADKYDLAQFKIKGFEAEVTIKIIWPSSRKLPRSVELFSNEFLCNNPTD